MKGKFKKLIVMCLVAMTMMTFTTITTHAISLDYSGGSSANDTGAGATTSGFSVTYSDTVKNVCGYRFSVVTSAGTPKSGTKVVNVFKSDITEGSAGYSSAHRFIISSGKIANKKQLANGTKVSSTTTIQSCDYKSGDCGFYSVIPQDPSSIGSWIKNSTNNYQNLSRIYVLCGTNLASASESDYVLIEPLFRPSLAGKRTVATATELAIYGAAVSGGDGYSGTNGNLYNAGSGTLWNLCNYVNREFPNALYVSSDNDVYSKVTISTSSRYTYKKIIQNGFGVSVLTVKNVIPIKKVKIAYHPNGGKVSDASLNDYGFIKLDGTVYFQTINHGKSADPYNASTFGMTRTGYQFAGWEVKSTGKVLDQNTEYASTVYAQHDDKSKTTANTATVYCYLYAKWTPNKVKIKYLVNGGTVSAAGYKLSSTGLSILRTSDNTNDWHTVKYGDSANPYNASTFGLKKSGYHFTGWKVKSTGKVLDQDTDYASTVYAQYDNKSKTTSNTASVVCELEAQWTLNTVKLAYHPNGGTASKAVLNDYGYLTMDGATYFHTFNHGTKEDPYNASTFGLTRAGYQFAGWKVKSTKKVLDQDTEYASTTYAQHDDKSKTSANTTTVYCYLYAVWEKNTYTNTIVHWKYVGTGGDNSNGTYKNMGSTTFTAKYGATATIPTGHVKSYTGYHNTGVAGSNWGTSTWSSKNIGATFTQPAKAVSMEYYYKPNEVNIAYNVNGGTLSSSTYTKNSNGFISDGSTLYFDYMDYGESDDPYNASTFGLTRAGYQFAGWTVRSTGKVLGQDTQYASTVYAQYNDATKTAANTKKVTCYLDAKWTPNKVKIKYLVNGGTVSASGYELSSSGESIFRTSDNTNDWHTVNYGVSEDPYNAATFGLKKTGYQFAGWKVKSTGKILDQDTEYASTVYAQYNDKTKTTANTATVICYLEAQWTPNKVKIKYLANGGTITADGYELSSSGESIFRTSDNTNDWHVISYGANDDPVNTTTFGLKKTGYQFAGWKVISTGKVLDQDTEYASTIYAQYNDKTKTTANTVSVVCHLEAQWTPNKVKIAYHPNGGTTSKSLNGSGYILLDGAAYFQTINHGTKGNPYNASTLELTRTGYTFKGWTVAGTSTVLNQDTDYASTVYKQYNDSSKTTANTTTVYCHLIAKWEKNTYTNTIVHWKYVGTGGDNANGTYKKMGTSTFSGIYANSITIPTSLIQAYTGHYNTGVAGSYWGTETWSHKNIGSTFTQPAKAVSIEYYYRPKTLTVIFNKNDGSGSTASQTFTYGVAGNQFGYNNDGTPKWGNNSGQFGAWDRENYTLLGWSENPDATASTYSVYNTVSNSWINTKVPDPNTSKTINLYAVWNSSAKIVIVPIEPNGSYRENTDVISSYWLVNISGDDYTPSTGASVVFKVYNASGSEIASSTQSFVSPNNDKNLAYFKWRVPNGYGGTNIKVTAHIVDGPNTYSRIERSYRVADFETYTTPDTDYKDKAPDDFAVPDSSYDNAAKARWWQWHYVGGSFVKKEYAVTNIVNDLQLTTDTNPSAQWNSGTLYMKSGYGFGCSYTHAMSVVDGYQSNSTSESVAPQYFYALFPEYNYTLGINKSRSFTNVSGRKTFVNATGMGRQHFTPIYYPNGAYKFQVVLSDCWTPAGMLTTYKTVTIQINGSMYDDWYVGRK